ncbi:MAG: hypothetical protein K1X55_07760 [Chitinophagales bacterium]|nr:hypothetical protein [Chitinophagales bacterium]
MSTVELQNQLISKIQITMDEDILENVLRFLEFETSKDEVYAFNEAEEQAIEKARQQVKNGQFYSDEELVKLTEKWLKG